MTTNLPPSPEKAKAVWRIVNAADPLLIAQSAKLSDAYAQLMLRMAEVEAIKELMVAEAGTIAEVRKKLIDKYLDAAPEDRIRLRQDVECAERELRRLRVYQKAIDHVPENQAAAGPTSTAEGLDPPEAFRAWLDTFDEYARRQNESWRAELLARALALEALNPGILGQRALWFVGTVDEKAFHAFAAVLDIASFIGGTHIIPNFGAHLEKPIPTCAIGPGFHLGNVLFLLSDLGLIGDMFQSQRIFPAQSPLVASYGPHRMVGTTRKEVRLGGIVLTALGDTIARLYEPKVNDLGLEIYNDWLNAARADSITIVEEIQARSQPDHL